LIVNKFDILRLPSTSTTASTPTSTLLQSPASPEELLEEDGEEFLEALTFESNLDLGGAQEMMEEIQIAEIEQVNPQVHENNIVFDSFTNVEAEETYQEFEEHALSEAYNEQEMDHEQAPHCEQDMLSETFSAFDEHQACNKYKEVEDQTANMSYDELKLQAHGMLCDEYKELMTNEAYNQENMSNEARYELARCMSNIVCNALTQNALNEAYEELLAAHNNTERPSRSEATITSVTQAAEVAVPVIDFAPDKKRANKPSVGIPLCIKKQKNEDEEKTNSEKLVERHIEKVNYEDEENNSIEDVEKTAWSRKNEELASTQSTSAFLASWAIPTASAILPTPIPALATSTVTRYKAEVGLDQFRLWFDFVPEQNNENLVQTVIDQCTLVGADVVPSDIEYAKRVGEWQWAWPDYQARKILACFKSLEKRRNVMNIYRALLKQKRNAKEDISLLPRIRECLPPNKVTILKRISHERNWQPRCINSYYVRDGNIFVQRRSCEQAHIIESVEQLIHLLYGR
jgi:hypothetical protein